MYPLFRLAGVPRVYIPCLFLQGSPIYVSLVYSHLRRPQTSCLGPWRGWCTAHPPSRQRSCSATSHGRSRNGRTSSNRCLHPQQTVTPVKCICIFLNILIRRKTFSFSEYYFISKFKKCVIWLRLTPCLHRWAQSWLPCHQWWFLKNVRNSDHKWVNQGHESYMSHQRAWIN